MFRPRDNARRLQRSAARFVMPELPESLFLEAVKALLRVDEKWVPAHGSGAVRERLVAMMSGRESDPYGWLEPI